MKIISLTPKFILGFGVLLLLAAGCATKKPVSQNYLFFPAAPDEPRIQYLTSFGNETDLGSSSKLNDFLVGEEKVYRPIWKPYGLSIKKGKVYVCDTQAANVSIADLVKRKIHYLKPKGQAAMKTPVNVAADLDGTVYVTDTGRAQVLIYDSAGNLVTALGKKDEMKPAGIAVFGSKLYVTDLANHCVRVYDKTSKELLFTAPRN